jgi:hypothetical protein
MDDYYNSKNGKQNNNENRHNNGRYGNMDKVNHGQAINGKNSVNYDQYS